MIQKYEDRVARLVSKIGASATPVPGLIVGLSGTDSLIAFLMCYDALECHDRAHRLYGIHYVNPDRRYPSWFEEHVLPWLRERCPKARIEVETPMGGNIDQMRWADLHLRALNDLSEKTPEGKPIVTLHDLDQGYWVVGTINATERYLGTYSLLADTASIQPLATLSKSAILAICEALGVPAIALDRARQPDCYCGRDELAAQNIELVDGIIEHNIDVFDADRSKLDMLLAYVHALRATNGFKERIPYNI